jgi:hypothetical protein
MSICKNRKRQDGQYLNSKEQHAVVYMIIFMENFNGYELRI